MALGTRKRRVGLRRRRVRRRGGSFFGSIGNALSKAHDWIKSNKVISTVGKALGSVGVPYAGAIGNAASTLGYGRRRRRVVRRRTVRKRRVGGSLRSILSSAHNFVKKHQLVSKGLSHFGHAKLASAASSLGYGRRRTVRRRAPARRMVRHRGGANFFSTEQIAAPRF
jgi:hypothetical protein